MIDFRTLVPLVPTTSTSTSTTEAAPEPAPAPAVENPTVADVYETEPLNAWEQFSARLVGESPIDPTTTTIDEVYRSLDAPRAPQSPGQRFLDRIRDASPLEGPEFVHLRDDWIPQGQGYDQGRGEVITSYYRHSGETMLSFQDKDSRESTDKHHVLLGGKGEDPPPSHAGGVSTNGDYVYVSDTDAVYVYERSELMEAERENRVAKAHDVTPLPIENPVDPNDPETDLISNGSFMTVKGKYAYVGGYSKDGDGDAGAVWRYEINQDTGKLKPGSKAGPIRAPDQAQGIAVVDGALLFTTGKHELVHQPYDEDTFTADIDLRDDISNGQIDPYAQGLNIIDGEVWVTYESGAEAYDQKVDRPRTRIQRIPIDQLDLQVAGITPEDLTG